MYNDDDDDGDDDNVFVKKGLHYSQCTAWIRCFVYQTVGVAWANVQGPRQQYAWMETDLNEYFLQCLMPSLQGHLS